MVDACLAEHGVVLDLRLAEGWAIVGNDDQFGLSLAKGSKGLLVAKDVFTTLDNEGKTGVD